jgi:hypothetical protein
MKNLTKTLFAVLLLAFVSCSEDESLIAPQNETASTPEEAIATAMKVITPETQFPFTMQYNPEKGVGSNNARTQAVAAVVGPFTVEATLQKVLTNHKVILTSTEGYATGVYLCDVYRAFRSITIPAGAIFSFQGASKFGYSNYSAVPKVEGINVTQIFTPSGSTYELSTWSIVPRYTQLGQALPPRVLPRDLTGLTFTYSYDI